MCEDLLLLFCLYTEYFGVLDGWSYKNDRQFENVTLKTYNGHFSNDTNFNINNSAAVVGGSKHLE